jgi:vacuolar protein-sorting-associated protein 4
MSSCNNDFIYMGFKLKVFGPLLQVKDVLFEPVRKTQDAMFFFKDPEGMWIPCGQKQPNAVQITMQDLATQGLASKVFK